MDLTPEEHSRFLHIFDAPTDTNLRNLNLRDFTTGNG